MSFSRHPDPPPGPPAPRPLYKNLTVQVLAAVAVGITVGVLWPSAGVALKPLGDGFIKLVRCVVGPVIFLTIVGGIAGVGDLRRVGRVGVKALVYFEVATTIALAIGLIVANVLKPGAGVDTAMSEADRQAALAYASKSHAFVDHLLAIIPDSLLSPFVNGELLQVLFVAILVGAAVATLPAHRQWIVVHVDRLTEVMFRIVAMIMRVAPLGAMGAMGTPSASTEPRRCCRC